MKALASRLTCLLCAAPPLLLISAPTLAQASGAYDQVAKLKADDPGLWDWLGWAVAVDGSTIVASAQIYGQVDPPDEAGAVYTFERDQTTGTSWTQTQKLFAADGYVGDDFGKCLELEGNSLFIAGDQQGWVTDPDRSKGAVYVFERASADEAWIQTTKIVPPQAENYDGFGCTDIVVEGDLLVAGSYFNDSQGTSAGSAYVYLRDSASGEWNQVRELFAPDAQAWDYFGGRLAMEGEYLFVGAPGRDTRGVDNSGAVYVFGRDVDGPDTWGYLQTLEPARPIADSSFGRSLAVDRNRLVVSARNSVAVYGPVGPNKRWQLVTYLRPSDPNGFRAGLVEIENNTISVANRLLDSDDTTDEGGVLVFSSDGPNSWIETAVLRAADPSYSLFLGWAADLDGDYIVAGAVNSGGGVSGSGAVYVFRSNTLFGDGFESGDTSSWGVTVP